MLHSALASDQAVIAVAATVRWMLRASVATDQAMIAVVSAIGLVAVGIALDSTIAANQAMVAVLTAVRLVVRIGTGNIVVITTVGPVIAIRVIGAIGTVVRVGAWVITIRIVRRPRMIVVGGSVDDGLVDIGVVVVDDVATATAAATPITVP